MLIDFCGLECIRNSINSTLDEYRNVLQGENREEEAIRFYTSLLGASGVDRHEDEIVNLLPMLNRVLLPVFLEADNLSYKAFSDKEIECIILKEPLDKAPYLDVYNVEFYKAS